MVRVRVPGGVCTPAQWLALDRAASDYANGTLRLTTRQAFQFHGVIKSNLKRTMQAINENLLDTIAACGDVNRNVMCNPNPHQSQAHAQRWSWRVRSATTSRRAPAPITVQLQNHSRPSCQRGDPPYPRPVSNVVTFAIGWFLLSKLCLMTRERGSHRHACDILYPTQTSTPTRTKRCKAPPVR